MGISYGCIGKAKKLDCTGSTTRPRITVKPRQEEESATENNPDDPCDNNIETDKNEEIPLFVVNHEIGSPKNKRTMFAWMRLGHSGVDLTGTGGQLLEVTLTQLAQHNTHSDAWIAIKGRVYNVTAYLDYHPGGREELMKGVGTDATQLFDQVHKWVSYENILKKCLVGDLIISEEEEKGVLINNNNVIDEKIQEKPKVILNWTQNDDDVTVMLTTSWFQMTCDRVVILKKKEGLKILYYLEDSIFVFHQELPEPIKDHIEVQIKENSNANVILKKAEVGLFWSVFGIPLEGHNTTFNTTNLKMDYMSCVLENKTQLTHDTWLIVIALPPPAYMPVPLGYHVYLRLPGSDHVRPYTPITSKLDQKILQEDFGQKLHFIIKIYPNGLVTSKLSQITAGDTLEVSIPDGLFQHHRVLSVTSDSNCTLVCLAAGTGITPMIKLMLHQLSINRKVVLLWFNKTEKDIAWKDDLVKLQRLHKSLLKVVHILSTGNIFWEGYCGRISAEILTKELPPPRKPFAQDSPSFICICGPTGFNLAAKRLVNDLGYREDHVHIFQG